MKKIKDILIIGIIFVILVIGAYFYGQRIGVLKSQPKISSATVEQKIESISELASSVYYYTNVGVFENQNEFQGFKIPLTQKRFIISYDGIIKAGVNLKDASVKIIDKEIIVKIPKSTILSHEIDYESVRVFDEKNSLFNPIKVDDFSDFTAEQKSIMEEKALENNLLEKANEEVREIVLKFLNLDKEISEKYIVKFE